MPPNVVHCRQRYAVCADVAGTLLLLLGPRAREVCLPGESHRSRVPLRSGNAPAGMRLVLLERLSRAGSGSLAGDGMWGV